MSCRNRPDVGRMQIGKGAERRGCFNLCEPIEPRRNLFLDTLLNLLKALRPPQVPGTEDVDGQMDKGMGLDTDGMEGSRSLGDMGRGPCTWYEEWSAGCG